MIALLTTAWAALTSRIGRYLAAIGIAAGILFAAYSKGRKDSRLNQTADRLRASNKAKEIENEVDGLGADAIDDRLDEWMRDG